MIALVPPLVLPLVLAGSAAGGPDASPAGARPAGDLLLQAERLVDDALAALAGGADACVATADVLARGALQGAHEDLATELAVALNHADPAEAAGVAEEAWTAFEDELRLVTAQHAARLDVCRLVGGGPYDPEIDPAQFVRAVDNPLFPLPVGTTWTYHRTSEEGLFESVVTVTPDVEVILGVPCTVVSDVERQDGVLVEETLDYYAQDAQGNVWYFGETTRNYEDGEDADQEGSWTAGLDGAKPGVLVHADPTVGTTYRQEFLLGHAEDLATVLALDATAVVPAGAFAGALATRNFSPLESEAEEKTWAAGVGLVLEVDVETGERLELVEVAWGP